MTIFHIDNVSACNTHVIMEINILNMITIQIYICVYIYTMYIYIYKPDYGTPVKA